jgi:hypothetical protein
MTLALVSEVQPVWLQEILNSYAIDLQAQQLLQKLVIQSPDEDGYFLQQGVIRKDQQIWVGENCALRTKIIVALHDSSLGGHSGITTT